MGGLFGKPKITNHDRAVLDLKNQRDKLRVYSKKLEQIIEKDSENIKQLLKDGKRDKALLTLKRKKYQEKLLSKNQALLDNLQEMVDNIAFAKMEAKVFQGLREGAKILKEIHQQIDLGELENIMIDTEEGIQKQKEIDELLGSRLTEEDEEDILNELRALQLEDAAENEVEVVSEKDDQNENEKSSSEEEEEVDLQLPNVPTDLPSPVDGRQPEKEEEEGDDQQVESHGKQRVLA